MDIMDVLKLTIISLVVVGILCFEVVIVAATIDSIKRKKENK